MIFLIEKKCLTIFTLSIGIIQACTNSVDPDQILQNVLAVICLKIRIFIFETKPF